MSEKRFHQFGLWVIDNPNFNGISIADLEDTELMSITEVVDLLNKQQSEINSLKRELKRFKDWINSDKYDYELTLSFIKNKGYSLRDVLEYEKGLKE